MLGSVALARSVLRGLCKNWIPANIVDCSQTHFFYLITVSNYFFYLEEKIMKLDINPE